jgi:hypothetical protein
MPDKQRYDASKCPIGYAKYDGNSIISMIEEIQRLEQVCADLLELFSYKEEEIRKLKEGSAKMERRLDAIVEAQLGYTSEEGLQVKPKRAEVENPVSLELRTDQVQMLEALLQAVNLCGAPHTTIEQRVEELLSELETSVGMSLVKEGDA